MCYTEIKLILQTYFLYIANKFVKSFLLLTSLDVFFKNKYNSDHLIALYYVKKFVVFSKNAILYA